MFKRIWMNLKSTLAGAAAGGDLITAGAKNKNVEQILSGIFVTLVGLLGKDNAEELPAKVETKVEVVLEK